MRGRRTCALSPSKTGQRRRAARAWVRLPAWHPTDRAEEGRGSSPFWVKLGESRPSGSPPATQILFARSTPPGDSARRANRSESIAALSDGLKEDGRTEAEPPPSNGGRPQPRLPSSARQWKNMRDRTGAPLAPWGARCPAPLAAQRSKR